MRDLVHPSLYPFVEGVSQTAGTDDVTPAVQGLQQDMWGRPYGDEQVPVVAIGGLGSSRWYLQVPDIYQQPRSGEALGTAFAASP